MSANKNYIDNKIEESYKSLSDNDLKKITEDNVSAYYRSDKIVLFGSSTLAGLLVMSPMAELFNAVGAQNLGKVIENENTFGAYLIIGTLLTLGSHIYSITGKRYQELIKYNSALNVLEKRQEVAKLKEYLPA